MKKITATAAAMSLAATVTFAGDLAEPVITEVEEAQASSAPWLPLLLIVGVGLLIASQDDGISVCQECQ